LSKNNAAPKEKFNLLDELPSAAGKSRYLKKKTGINAIFDAGLF
jgi:hypothetical protein